jgi:hypothetical protein
VCRLVVLTGQPCSAIEPHQGCLRRAFRLGSSDSYLQPDIIAPIVVAISGVG